MNLHIIRAHTMGTMINIMALPRLVRTLTESKIQYGINEMKLKNLTIFNVDFFKRNGNIEWDFWLYKENNEYVLKTFQNINGNMVEVSSQIHDMDL